MNFDFFERIEKERRWKRFWGRVTGVCNILLIAAVIFVAIKAGYLGSANFYLFCAAAAVFVTCKYIIYPLWDTVDFSRGRKDIKYLLDNMHFRNTFTSAFGCGNVLFGRFYRAPDWPSVSYSFLAIMYIPLIPTGCYDINGSGKSRLDLIGEAEYSTNKYEWILLEVFYIYVKCWSVAVMVFTVLNVLIEDYLKVSTGLN